MTQAQAFEFTHRRSRSHRRKGGASSSFEAGSVETRPVLVAITDLCWWSTFLAVIVCFGGRAATGQLVLVIGASITSACWLLHCLTTKEPKYTWTGSEWVWLLGIAVGVAQIIPLPYDWLVAISPRTKEILPLWFDREASDIFQKGWNQLSLAPWETASGIATFTAYAILFLVAAQRIQTVTDVGYQLCGASLVAVAMSAFALVQFLASNGKFYWFIQHPFMSTDGTPHGSFTNHNHLSQFISLGAAPIIWWILRPSKQEDDSGFGTSTPTPNWLGALSLALGLAVMSLTVLLTASRGGLLALGLSTVVSLTIFCRIGLASTKFVGGLVCTGALTAIIFYFTGYESLAQRVDMTAEGGTRATGRLEIWKANLDVAKDFPILGTGVGTHEDSHQLRIDAENSDLYVYTHAESGYMQVASESGLAGLMVMLLMILTSMRWCVVALWNSDVRCQSAAAAVTASLIANVCHAVGDFFWYTPACMLLLAVQLACACRLSALTRQSTGRSTWTFSLPRPLTLIAGCGLAASAFFMVNLKIPGALADPELMRYLTLSFQERPQDEDDGLEQDEEARQAIIKAAKLDPHDSRLQEKAAIAYMEMFDARQAQNTDNQMTHAQIRDAILTMEFETTDAKNAWLRRAFGTNIKLLQLSRKYFLRALQASPLRVHSYIDLLEVGFLEPANPDKDAKYLKQVLKIRPRDPQVLFAVGKNVLLTGDLTGGLKYWRDAYHRSPQLRTKISEGLVERIDADLFLESFEPEWRALHSLARAYDRVVRPDQSRIVWQKCIEDGETRRRRKLTTTDREAVILMLRDAYFAMEEPNRAIRLLIQAQKEDPYDLPIRTRLAWDLFEAGRLTEAAEHLKWCASRSPNDAALQHAASVAIKERLKSIAFRSSSNPS